MVEHLSPDTPILATDGLSVVDYWTWAYSDILCNVNRGVFAEFLVGAALDALQCPRIEWDACDLRYQDKKVEVKSSAYLQSWIQKKPSEITFDIAPKMGLNTMTGEYSLEACRAADIYVFCLFTEQNVEYANILDASQWEFYILPAQCLNEKLGIQKSNHLNPLRRLCEPVSYSQLKQTVDALI